MPGPRSTVWNSGNSSSKKMASSTSNQSTAVIMAKLVSQDLVGQRLDPEYVLGDQFKNEFFIGRHVKADCLIKDVQVSRWHAIFKFDVEKSAWVIHDQGSRNGVHINGKPVEHKGNMVLKNGDKIGINEYEWLFEFPASGPGPASRINEGLSYLKSSLRTYIVDKVSEKLETMNAVNEKIRESEATQKALTGERDNLLKQLKEEKLKFTANQENERKSFEKRLSETKKEIAEAERRQFEKKMKEDAEKMEKRQKEMSALCDEKIKNVKAKVDETTKQKDALMLEIEKLKSEAATEKAAKERERDEKVRMALELETKRDEIAKLNRALQVQKKRQETDEVLARKELKSDFMSHCNNELKCPICDELFIDPVGLDCGHVYCDFCINQWKTSRKDDFTCPNCRQKVENITKSLHIKNLIDAVYESADAALKSEREDVIKERQAEAKAAAKPIKTTKRTANPTTRATITTSSSSRAPSRPVQTRPTVVSAPRQTAPAVVVRMPARSQATLSGTRPTAVLSNLRPNLRPIAPATSGRAQPNVVRIQRSQVTATTTVQTGDGLRDLVRNLPGLRAAAARAVSNQVSQLPPVSSATMANRRMVTVRVVNGSGTQRFNNTNTVVINGRTIPVIPID